MNRFPLLLCIPRGLAARVLMQLVLSVASGWGASAMAIDPPVLAPPPGIVRVAGSAQMEAIVQRWADRLAADTPVLRVQPNLRGSDVGMAALYTAQAEVALLGREATADEEKAFEWIFRYKPTRIELMTGSVDRAGRSPALAVLVHRANPLERISLRQLAALFAHAPSGDAAIRRWGQLGLDGRWRNQPVRLYATQSESGTGRHFRNAVLAGATALDWPALSEFDDPVGPPSRVDDSGSRIAAALAGDPLGLAIGVLPKGDGRVRALALAADGDGPWIGPTRASVQDRSYPLSRAVYAYVNRPPGKPLDAQTRRFLQHALSARGQAAIHRADGWLPLHRDILIHQRHLIEQPP